MSTVTIYHFDDEPDTVLWIPGSLLNHYWTHWPKWICDDGLIEWTDAEQTATFDLNASGTRTTVRYRSLGSLEAFTAAMSEITERDIVVLDIMRVSRVDDRVEWENDGLKAFSVVRERLSTARILFLTGWAPRIPADIRKAVPRGHVMSKPPDAYEFIGKLVVMLRVGCDDE